MKKVEKRVDLRKSRIVRYRPIAQRLLFLLESSEKRVTLHSGVEATQVSEIAKVPEISKIAEVRLMGIIPDLMETDQLIGKRGGVLVGRRTGRDTGRGGGGRGFLRRVERLVEVRPRGWMMTGRIMEMIKGIEGMLHRGYRIYRNRGYRREGRATVRMMISRRSRLGRLLPRIVFDRVTGGPMSMAGQ